MIVCEFFGVLQYPCVGENFDFAICLVGLMI